MTAKEQVAELRRRVAQLREQERSLYAEVSDVLQEADEAQAEVQPYTLAMHACASWHAPGMQYLEGNFAGCVSLYTDRKNVWLRSVMRNPHPFPPSPILNLCKFSSHTYHTIAASCTTPHSSVTNCGAQRLYP